MSRLDNSRFTKVARAMSRNHDVEVVFGDVTPSTNGRTIYLPANADKLPGHCQDSLQGWLDHEVMHVEEEKMARDHGTVSPLSLQARAVSLGKHVALMHNVYEDIRGELRVSEQWPGVAANLRRVNERSVQAYRDNKHNFWQDLGAYIIMAARGLPTDWATPELLAVVNRIRDLIATASVVGHPAQMAFDLAVETVKRVKDFSEEMEEEQERREEEQEQAQEQAQDNESEEGGSEGERGEDEDEDSEDDGAGSGGDDDSEEDSEDKDDGGDSDGEDSDGEGDEGDDGEEASDEGDEGEDSEGSDGDDGDAEGQDNGEDTSEAGKEGGEESEGGEGQGGESDASSQQEGSEPAEMSDSELEAARDFIRGSEKQPETTDFIRALAEEIRQEATADAMTNQRCIAPDHIVKRDGLVPLPPITAKDAETYDRVKAEVNEQISAMRRKMSTILQARSQVHYRGDCEEGDLDATALAQLRHGERRVFAQKTQAQKLDTAVTLLVDCSGSMRDNTDKGDCAYYAQRTAIALAETLSAVNVPFEVLGFDNEHTYAKSLPPGCTRWAPFRIRAFKAFGDNLRKVRARFAHIRGYDNNGDGDSLRFAARRLAQRPEARKLLIVISDGRPNGPAPTGVLERDLHLAIQEITGAGIEVHGVGAGSGGRDVERFYTIANNATNVVITDLTKMATMMVRLLRARLMRGGKVAA